ncbi:Z1 domain-containing protein [Paenibacillus beijingensis]|uniref:Putative endonuclease Z1 domain-containing protein n=1 Tax=Paenibacillus beijingensis TaxID=1126833 RepID=A0A0D5NFY9_9BACL|nr:Z1 domain-containing protein [Paenibacillus beijingensis]AJY74294.1 hypothetical protein VN24_06495 [Paenibacillus beijingensis]
MDKTIEMKVKNNSNSWPIISDGFFRMKMTEQLTKDDIPRDAVDKIFQNSINILSNCPNPKDENPNSKTGIIIGKVQSGKTSNFISLMALAFDNDYDIIVVLGGTKNILLGQNVARIRSYFSNIEMDKMVILATNQNESILNPTAIKQFIQEKRKVVIVGLKGKVRINTIAGIFSDPILCNVPTLVIDDEGDQATLNTQASRNSMSATYEAAVTLKARLQRHCFLSITATPQANILIKTCDQLSPDFGSLVYPGDDYCGLDEFHGEIQDTYIKLIPDNEPSILEDVGLPLSFYKALAAFFIGGAIRVYRGDNRNHAMLIHPSQRKYDHQIVLRKVNSVLNEWREHARAKLDGIEDISYQNLSTHLEKAYVDFQNDGVILPSFSELENYILECIGMCPDAHLCNGDEDASENSRFYRVNIFVGGNLVERGLTIKGLAVTYIIRRARGVSNVDNTEQRARWFGYKRSFLDVCRVFTTQPIKDDFSSILEHDDDLWATIERAELRGAHFKEIPRVFVLANKMLNMTRRNVARAERFSFSEWNKQDILLLNRLSVDSNSAYISAFRDRHHDLIEILDYHGVNKHAFIKGLDFFELKRTLLDHLVFPKTSVLDQTFFNKIEEALIKSDINPVVDILWIRDTAHETRTISSSGKINQLFQGRNSNQGSKTYYPGDSNMVTIERSDVMQLQIHFIKPKNFPEINYYSPAIALYVPVAYSEQMERLVGQI